MFGPDYLRKIAATLYSPPIKRHIRALLVGHFSDQGAMPEVIFPGPEGRLEGRFSPPPRPRAPVAMILHPHPQANGTMNNRIVQALYQTFVRRGFAVLRFNFRGVGKSQGTFDNGVGELSDAAAALDWVQSFHPEAQQTWVAGVSFGAWIGMQLLMRRPEVRGFISIAPPANMYDFSFLAPCPASGIIVQGEADEVVTPSAVQKLVDKLRTQKHITIHHDTIPGANHFFEHEMPQLMASVDRYLDFRLDPSCPIR
jgi:alpha/beta superfamily hydrolase